MRRPRRTVLLACVGALAALLVLAPVASADFFSPPNGPTPNENSVITLWWIVFALACVVFVGVEGAMCYAMWRYRARKGTVAAQIHGNTTLEISWTVGAAVILVILAAVTFGFLSSIRQPQDNDANGYFGPGYGIVTNEKGTSTSPRTGATYPPSGKALLIHVNGQQYLWRYTYPDGDNNPLNNVFSYEQMVVPTHTTVMLDITSSDVVHSWWVPELGGKFQAVPGYTNHTWFKISKPGVYPGQCADLCGRNHANMIAEVKAVPPAQYAAWLTEKRREIAAAQQAVIQQRKQLQGNQPTTP